jgi:hypothetical protein
LAFCRVSSLRSHCLIALPFIPLAGYRSGLRSSFPARPSLLAPPFGIGVLQYPCRLHDLLRPLLLRHGQDESLYPQTRFRDMSQISRGKFDRLRSATAGFTTSGLDGYGLRNHWLARRPPRPQPVACSSVRIFASRFFQASPRGEYYLTLALC